MFSLPYSKNKIETTKPKLARQLGWQATTCNAQCDRPLCPCALLWRIFPTGKTPPHSVEKSSRRSFPCKTLRPSESSPKTIPAPEISYALSLTIVMPMIRRETHPTVHIALDGDGWGVRLFRWKNPLSRYHYSTPPSS